jgi:hypothetical protein
MGWRIHRVWSTDWFYEREAALAGVLRSIEQAVARPPSDGILAAAVDVPSVDTVIRNTPSTQVIERKYAAGRPYRLFQPSVRLDRDHLLQPGHATTLARTIGEFVALEGPVERDLLVERLKELHGVERAGSNIQANIKNAIGYAIRWQTVAHQSPSSFYYDPARQVQEFRVPANGISRRVDQIAPEELAFAVLHLVEDQFGLAEERAPVSVARLFGIERLGSEHADIIASVVDSLVSNGALRRSGVQLHLA